MLDLKDLRCAARDNDAVLEELGGEDASWQAVSQSLGIDVMSLMSFAFEYAGKNSPADAEELFEMLHVAFCYGSITTARALQSQSADGFAKAA